MPPDNSGKLPDPLASRLLNWLDNRDDWTFVGILYLLRWPIVIFLGYLQGMLAEALRLDVQTGMPDVPLGLFLLFVMLILVAPCLETLLECALPYWIMSRKRRMPRRPWLFVTISACIMLVLHPLIAAPTTFVTGVFLACCYARCAASSSWRAIGFTCLFHAGINAVGWIGIATGIIEL